MIQFRSQLRERLASLRIGVREHLRVVYTPPLDESGWVDLENVTLYNVGMSSFAHLLDRGISCERLNPFGSTHRMTYQGARDWPERTGEAVAQVRGELSHIPSSTSEWWQAFRKMEIQATQRLALGEEFRLQLTVHVPNPAGWLGPKLKSMLDGLVAATQAHDGSNRDLLEQRLDAQLGQRSWELLIDDTHAVLPTCQLLRPTTERYAWNPSDDLCTAFDVRVEAGRPFVAVHVSRYAELSGLSAAADLNPAAANSQPAR